MRRLLAALMLSVLWRAPWALELQLDGSELAGWDLVWVVQEGRVIGGAIVSPGPITLQLRPHTTAPLELQLERWRNDCTALTCTATLEATHSAGTVPVPAPRYYVLFPYVVAGGSWPAASPASLMPEDSARTRYF